VNPDVLYANVEAANGKGGIYRSSDNGVTWERRSDYNQGSMYYGDIFADPVNVDRVYVPDVVFQVSDDGGKTLRSLGTRNMHVDIVRYDKRDGERIGIQPQEEKGGTPLRWNWDAPFIISPHLHTRLYFGSQFMYRSDDKGNSWKIISPDLTRKIDRNTLPVMGRVWGPDAVAKST